MKYTTFICCGSVLLLTGCAVVAVGAAAVSVTTTAVGLTYDVGKTVVTGTYAAGEMAVDAMTSPTASTSATLPTNSVSPDPHVHTVEVQPFKD